jgi:hypothetical protein
MQVELSINGERAGKEEERYWRQRDDKGKKRIEERCGARDGAEFRHMFR